MEQLNLNIERPKRFFKFLKLNDHLFELLRAGSFWFSAQDELNDPYDCKYFLSDEYLLNLLKKSSSHLLKDLQDRVPQFKNLDSDRFFEIMLPKLKSEESLNMCYNMLFKEGLGWCVCCFTTDLITPLINLTTK